MRFKLKPILVMFLILCLVMVVVVGGCSSQKPSPSPKPEPIPLPEPEPEPEPEPAFNFDNEEWLGDFLERSHEEIITEFGDPRFINEEGGEVFGEYAAFFDDSGKCHRTMCGERKKEFLGITIEETSLEEALLLFGEGYFYEEEISEIHEFSTFWYRYEWEGIWKEEVRSFKVSFASDYREGIKGVEVELLPRP